MGDENALLDFRKRFDDFKTLESQRRSLIQAHHEAHELTVVDEDLLDQNARLVYDCKQTGQDLAIEKDARRQLQTRIKDELEPLMFRDDFLDKNEVGGRLVADELLAQVNHYIKGLNLDVENTDVVVRAYANLRGLGKACAKNNSMKSTADLGLVANGFTSRYPLFDFVDVGLGKERADHKIRESFRFYIESSQCKHVLLGICHDSGYVPFFEKFVANESVRNRVTLLEGYQVSPAIRSLGFKRKVRFPSVFAPGWTPIAQNSGDQAQTPTTVTGTRATKAPFHCSAVDASRLGPILKNEQGKRIDKHLRVDPETVQALMEKHLCTWLFLKGFCAGCERNHAHRPLNEQQYDALWFVSRRGRCFKDQKSKGCNDPTCIYGHAA
ncbi:MAG: hypothetical protein Q9192_007525 [Flavoplaca navasiana]